MAKPVGTCGHCRLPIEESDGVVIFEDGRLIHVGCWRVSDSATSRQSSDLVRRSRKLIDNSRRALDELHSLADKRMGDLDQPCCAPSPRRLLAADRDRANDRRTVSGEPARKRTYGAQDSPKRRCGG